MAALNYAKEYQQALANAYGYVLNFGRLWTTDQTGKYRVINAKTIELPVLSTKGRVDGDRDTISAKTRRFDNKWEAKTLSNHRKWDTLVHPQDINQTNQIASIQNITKTMNETQKFPEMDAYLISTLYSLRNAVEPIVQETADLTVNNVLAKFDKLMDDMDDALVPANGRLLYVDTATKTLIDNAITITRQNKDGVISRAVSRIDEVEIIPVPTSLMKTAYDFTEGWVAETTAKQIAMLLVHPSAVLPIAQYEFAQLDAPSALSDGKWVYFEESFEDVFILNERYKAISFVVAKDKA